jgi:CubicO group peptidase (beta-lactamase class C family)
MMLAGGVWEGRQVVPRDWLERSLKPAIAIEDGRAYGYHWYLGEMAAEPPTGRRWQSIAAIGNGGQRLYLVPKLDLVVAITAGNYNKRDQGVPPLRVMREVVLASVV